MLSLKKLAGINLEPCRLFECNIMSRFRVAFTPPLEKIIIYSELTLSSGDL